MPVAPPHGSKLATNCLTASLTPMVARAKNAPRNRKMPEPKTSASRLTAAPAMSPAATSGPMPPRHQIDADIAAETEEDDVAEIDVAGISDHHVQIARQRDVHGRQQKALAQPDIVAPVRNERKQHAEQDDQGREDAPRRGDLGRRLPAGILLSRPKSFRPTSLRRSCRCAETHSRRTCAGVRRATARKCRAETPPGRRRRARTR